MEVWTAFRFSKHHNWKVSTGDDNWFADCGMDGEANAKRIVKAVNCHDDLYEALRGIVAQFSLVEPLYAKDREYIAQTDKALARAGEK